MSRLTTYEIDGPVLKHSNGKTCDKICFSKCSCDDCPIQNGVDKLSDYEDAEETGLLIHLPKQDDPIYDPRFGEIDVYLFSGIIWECKQIGVWGYRTDGRDEVTKICKFYEIGKTVFLTREEAENALRENNNE